MISPYAAKQEYLKRQIKRQEKLEAFFDEILASEFSGDPLIITRSSTCSKKIPWPENINGLLSQYRKSGWQIEEKKVTSEQGIDKILIFKESSDQSSRLSSRLIGKSCPSCQTILIVTEKGDLWCKNCLWTNDDDKEIS